MPERYRRILTVLGWVVAAIALVLYLSTKYEFSFRKKSALDEPLTSTPTPTGDPKSAVARTKPSVTAGTSAPQQNHVFSTEQLFQLASPAVVLLEVYDNEGHKRSLGSGFAASNSGSIITNYHVIRGASKVTVKFGDGTFAPVLGVVSYDPDRDVAVIKIQEISAPTLKLGNSEGMHVGDHVVAIGSPLGLQNTLSEGIVSAIRGNVIQMSAPISPGSSGGPVLNTAGEVVAISVATIVAGQNLNFAVPINWAKRYLQATSPRSLSDIAQENMVEQPILKGVVSVPAGQKQNWIFQVNPSSMSDTELHGEIHSTGGLDGFVTLSLYFGKQLIYNCPHQTDCTIHEDLSLPGTYTLVADNTSSFMFPRQVSGEIDLGYVK